MFTVHLMTRVFCSALAKEFTATRTLYLRFAPYPRLVISFGQAPAFRVKHVVYNEFDGSFTAAEAKMDGLVTTEAALQEWSASWRAVGFEVPDPTAPRPPYLRLVT